MRYGLVTSVDKCKKTGSSQRRTQEVISPNNLWNRCTMKMPYGMYRAFVVADSETVVALVVPLACSLSFADAARALRPRLLQWQHQSPRLLQWLRLQRHQRLRQRYLRALYNMPVKQ